MGQRHRGRGGRERGGITGLARLIEEHGPALDYDLLTLTRYNLSDVGGALPWAALRHFVDHLPRTSALSRDLVPLSDEERWIAGDANCIILADIYDAIAQVGANLMAKGSGRAPRHMRPYPRPWDNGSGERRFGSDPIPISEFEDWWNS